MAEEYKVFRFEIGLQEWARKELLKLQRIRRTRPRPQQCEYLKVDYGESSSTTKSEKTSKETLCPMENRSMGRWVGQGKAMVPVVRSASDFLCEMRGVYCASSLR